MPTNDFSLLTRTALPIPDATGDVRRWVPRHSDRFRMYIPPNCEASNLLELMVLPPMRCACFPACSEVVVSHNSRLVRSRVLLMWWNIFSAKPLWRQRVRFLVSTAPAGRAERREVSSGGGKNNRVVVIAILTSHFRPQKDHASICQSSNISCKLSLRHRTRNHSSPSSSRTSIWREVHLRMSRKKTEHTASRTGLRLARFTFCSLSFLLSHTPSRRRTATSLLRFRNLSQSLRPSNCWEDVLQRFEHQQCSSQNVISDSFN